MQPTTYTVTTVIKGKEYKATAETYIKALNKLKELHKQQESKK